MKPSKSKDPELEFLLKVEAAAMQLFQVAGDLWNETLESRVRYQNCLAGLPPEGPEEVWNPRTLTWQARARLAQKAAKAKRAA